MPEIPDAIFGFVKRCNHCGDDVVWARENGKGLDAPRVPIHAIPQPDGNLTLFPKQDSHEKRPHLEFGRPTKNQAAGMLAAGMKLYKRHALLCPQAHRWSSNATGYGYASRQPAGTNPIRHANPGRAPARKPKKTDERGGNKKWSN